MLFPSDLGIQRRHSWISDSSWVSCLKCTYLHQRPGLSEQVEISVILSHKMFNCRLWSRCYEQKYFRSSGARIDNALFRNVNLPDYSTLHTLTQLLHVMRNVCDTDQNKRCVTHSTFVKRCATHSTLVTLVMTRSPSWEQSVREWSCSSHRKVSSSHSCRNAPPPSLSQILHLHKTHKFSISQSYKQTEECWEQCIFIEFTSQTASQGRCWVFTRQRK